MIQPFVRRKPAIENRNGMNVTVREEDAIEDVTR
jgi:hypothetical protein